MDLLKLAFSTLPALVFLDYMEKVGDIILIIDVILER